MQKLMIENGILIDDIDSVKVGIEKLSGKYISDAGTIRRFITSEKNTKFYLDSKCLCTMQPDRGSVYLWLDSGYTDSHGNPIMISLLNKGEVYSGHFFGTMVELVKAIKSFYPRNEKDINRNFASFKSKYQKKAEDRVHRHIGNERDYLLNLCNGDENETVMSRLLKGIELAVPEEPEEVAKTEPVAEEEAVKEPAYDMNFREKEITIGLLLETIEDMQGYIDELLAEIEKFNSEDRVKMKELEEKNEEYKRALVQMRSFIGTEAKEEEEVGPSGFGGHELLGRNGKILVLGATVLDVNTMNGLAKLFGFQKKDLEYETDYTKMVSHAGRIKNGEKYSAIILGACPHKVAGLGDWSNLIEKCKQSPDMPPAFDARSRSGELKVTKESFKMALMDVCKELKRRNGGY